MAFFQILVTNPIKFLGPKASGLNAKKLKKLCTLNLQLQTIQILTNGEQVLVLCLSYFITTVCYCIRITQTAVV